MPLPKSVGDAALSGWTSENWTLFWVAVTGAATAGLVVVALVAALYARSQLAEARTARETASRDAYELQKRAAADALALQTKASDLAHALQLEQIAPYVVIYKEQSKADLNAFDLVCKNYGQTAASDVRVEYDPPLQRTRPNAPNQPMPWPECIPTLAPGQEYRAFWDTGVEHIQSDLPKAHKAVVSYRDAHGRSLTTNAILDWTMHRTQSMLGVKGVHELAKAAEGMLQALRSYREGNSDNAGMKIWVRDGNVKDQREEQSYREQVEAIRRFESQEAQTPTEPVS